MMYSGDDSVVIMSSYSYYTNRLIIKRTDATETLSRQKVRYGVVKVDDSTANTLYDAFDNTFKRHRKLHSSRCFSVELSVWMILQDVL